MRLLLELVVWYPLALGAVVRDWLLEAGYELLLLTLIGQSAE